MADPWDSKLIQHKSLSTLLRKYYDKVGYSFIVHEIKPRWWTSFPCAMCGAPPNEYWENNVAVQCSKNSHMNRLVCHRCAIALKSLLVLYEKKHSCMTQFTLLIKRVEVSVTVLGLWFLLFLVSQSSSQNWPCLSLKASCSWGFSVWGREHSLPFHLKASRPFALAQAFAGTQLLLHLTDLWIQIYCRLLVSQYCNAFARKEAEEASGQKEEDCLTALPLLQQTTYEDNTYLALGKETAE